MYTIYNKIHLAKSKCFLFYILILPQKRDTNSPKIPYNSLNIRCIDLFELYYKVSYQTRNGVIDLGFMDLIILENGPTTILF